MDWALRGLQAVAPWAPFLCAPRCPDCHCIADCAVSSDIVDLLGRQLERCGPEQLTCPACPGCPVVKCPEPPFAWTAFFSGSVVGAFTVAAVLLLALRGARAVKSLGQDGGAAHPRRAHPALLAEPGGGLEGLGDRTRYEGEEKDSYKC